MVFLGGYPAAAASADSVILHSVPIFASVEAGGCGSSTGAMQAGAGAGDSSNASAGGAGADVEFFSRHYATSDGILSSPPPQSPPT